MDEQREPIPETTEQAPEASAATEQTPEAPASTQEQNAGAGSAAPGNASAPKQGGETNSSLPVNGDSPQQDAGANSSAPVQAGELSAEQIKNLARELAKELTPPPEEPPAEPTEEEKKAELKRQKAERSKKSRKRLLRSFRSLIIRTLLLAVVMYILFFHLVGVTVMPSGDMYPRIDAGDLVLFYRLEHSFKAQDIIVFEKPASALVIQEKTEETEETPAEAIPPEAEEENAPEETETTEEKKTVPDMIASREAQEEKEPDKPWYDQALDTVKGWYHAAKKWLGFKEPDAEPTTMFICRVVAAPGDVVEISESGRVIVNGNAMIESNIFFTTPEYYGLVEYPVKLSQGEYFVLADYRNGGADSRFFGPVTEEEILGTVITIVRRNNL